MKQIAIKISAVLMALVVFLSTMSFTIDMHYCGDFLVDAALFSRAESCEGEVEESGVESCGVVKNCCSNENIVIDGQDELHFDIFDYSVVDQQVFVAAFVNTYVNLFESLHNKFIPFEEYSPPIVVADIQVLHQVFII